MFTEKEIAHIRQTVFSLVGAHYEGTIRVKEGPGLRVTGGPSGATIACESKSALARGFFRLAQELYAGAEHVDIREEKRFASCGTLLDLSRNAVMTVEACKRFMDHQAALGLDLVILYMEDTYTVPEYPYFGYLRGRYTKEELRELDDYAASLGLELVPCIQTLGHLQQFLQWRASEHLRDQAAVLLADDPETDAFIEAEIRAVRDCVRTKRLHIGMDEAHGVGLGRYYALNGPQDRFELLCRHLKKVVAACEKYGFRPIMWSDMFYRLGSKNNEYYDPDVEIPPFVAEALPNVDLCYWDYYHTSEAFYDRMLCGHKRLTPNVAFAGGIWTWSGFLPHPELTYATTFPALRSCARHRIGTVIATLWGDDGAETNYSLALSQLPLFSETCWRGECDRELVEATGEFLTKLPREAYRAFSLFYPDDTDTRTGKALVYCDPLYPLGPSGDALTTAAERARQALAALAPYRDRADCRYASALFDVCYQKALLLGALRPLYLAGDRDGLRDIAERDIPALLCAYDRLRALHKALWAAENKRNGWEVLTLRYGAVAGRLKDARETLLDYADGRLATICELDETPLDSARDYGTQWYRVFVTPTAREG